MPTDIALVLMRKAEAEAQQLKDEQDNLVIVCLWTTIGLVLAALMFEFGFDPTLAQTLVVNG
jgi:hypothetical protein